MKYYVKEINKSDLSDKTAGVKARADAEAIFIENGLTKIEIPSVIENRESAGSVEKLKIHVQLYSLWKESLKDLKKGDWVYIQFPLVEHTVLFFKVVSHLERKGVHVSVLIHDVEAIRAALRDDVSVKKKVRLQFEENSVFQKCSQVIAHNGQMKELLIRKLHVKKEKITVLTIFDYLMKDYDADRMSKRNINREEPVIIAGALVRHKVGYVYKLPENYPFNLYGIGYEEQNQANIDYKGAFDPDELPYVLDGSFGLIWDGETADTCTGVYGEYLRVNNPHKTSLYLASGIPVIIWEEAALAEFVRNYKCGITVGSLSEIDERIHALTDEEYAQLKANAEKVGSRLRKGYFLTRMIEAGK